MKLIHYIVRPYAFAVAADYNLYYEKDCTLTKEDIVKIKETAAKNNECHPSQIVIANIMDVSQ